MDVMHARVALRERGLLDTLDLTLRFVFSQKAIYAKMMAIVLIPAFLVTWGLGTWAGWAWGWVFTFMVSWVAEAPFVTLASRLVFEEKVKLGSILKDALKALMRLTTARFLRTMALGVGLMFFALPAAWVGTATFFLAEVIVLEQASISGGFGRAQRIASTNFGEALLTYGFLALMPILGVLLIDIGGRELLAEIFQVKPPPAIWDEGGGALPLLAYWSLLPLLTTARFMMYINFRTRTEGWDIQTRFTAIAARAMSAAEKGEA